MGNLCSIFHDRHDLIKTLTGNSSKAEFLSKCIYFWQISTYKIKNSDHFWFTQTTEELAKRSGLSESSVTRYLSEYVKNELIEKRVLKRYSKKHGHEITCLHIRITEKLQVLLGKSKTRRQTNSNTDPKNNFLSSSDDSRIVNLTIPYNKENKNKLNNIDVSKKSIVTFVNKKNIFKKSNYLIESEIGEQLTEEVKNRIKGMMFNVVKKEKIKISNPEQVFAEISFSLLNNEQFKGIDCFKHKLNIVASLLKQNRWKTPHGFYNHWDIGKALKERHKAQELKMQNKKLLNTTDDIQYMTKIKSIYNNDLSEKKLNILNQRIWEEGSLLTVLERKFRLGNKEITKKMIEQKNRHLSRLYDKQRKLEESLSILS